MEGKHYGPRTEIQGHSKGHKCPDCVASRKMEMKWLYQETDMSLEKIAEQLGVARWTVNYHLQQMGLKT